MSEKPPSVARVFVPLMHGLRGWAVLIVFMFHVTGATSYVPNSAVPRALLEGSGFLALEVLFFTTGFVLFLPVVLSNGFGSVRSFAVRRFFRLAPAYYVCLLVILVAYPLLSTDLATAAASIGATDYLIHLTFLQRELLPSHVGLGVNGPLWALSMDMTFYLLLPLVARAYLRRPLVGMGVAFAVSLAWRLLVDEPVTRSDVLVHFPLFCADFGAGMTAAWLFVRLKHARRSVSPRSAVAVAAVALLAAVGLVYVAGSTMPYPRAPFQGADAAMLAFPLTLGLFVVAAALSPARAQWPLTNRAAMWFGEINLSIYLYHGMVLLFALVTLGLSTNGSPRAVVTMTLVALPITLALAVLSYRLVEVPWRRYGRGLARRVGRSRASVERTADATERGQPLVPRAISHTAPALPKFHAFEHSRRWRATEPLALLGVKLRSWRRRTGR